MTFMTCMLYDTISIHTLTLRVTKNFNKLRGIIK